MKLLVAILWDLLLAIQVLCAAAAFLALQRRPR
jgi:hypothetical protein